MSKIICILFLLLSITACKNEPNNHRVSESIGLPVSQEKEVEIINETIYLFGRFDGKVRACTTCDDYQKTHTWITKITEFNTLSHLEKEKQMDRWEDKLRQIFPGIKMINRNAISGEDYLEVSQKRRELLSTEDASPTDALIDF